MAPGHRPFHRTMDGRRVTSAWAGRRRGNAELFPFPAVDASVARMGKRRAFRDHAILVAGAVVMALPLWLAFVAATREGSFGLLPGEALQRNLDTVVSLPPELLEAARLDGAGPVRFLAEFAVPLSWPMIGAVFAVAFTLGWNQYLWPLMISVDNAQFTLMRGVGLLGDGSGASFTLAAVSLLPPLVLVAGALRLRRRSTPWRT